MNPIHQSSITAVLMGLVSACHLGTMNGRWNWIRLIFRDCEWKKKKRLGCEWRREEDKMKNDEQIEDGGTRANWKRNREEWPDLRGCGVNSLNHLLCVCLCVRICARACMCARVCLCDSGCSPNENKVNWGLCLGQFYSDIPTGARTTFDTYPLPSIKRESDRQFYCFNPPIQAEVLFRNKIYLVRKWPATFGLWPSTQPAPLLALSRLRKFVVLRYLFKLSETTAYGFILQVH